MKHLNLKKKANQGFSLVEMLVVIAVIGVIAAIAIPSIGSINASAKTAVAERNAQSVMSVYQSGLAAGATWTPVTDAASLITAVVKGTLGTGAFSSTNFQVPGMSAGDQSDIVTGAYISKDASTGAWSYGGP
jgi:type IV pilus assembly protein PilA